MNYDEFISGKIKSVIPSGFTPDDDLNPNLFPWQKRVVLWALRQGKSALFEECGLGKTLQQLAWAHEVARFTGKPVLILCPLAVAKQTIAEAAKFGFPLVTAVESSHEITAPAVYISNYEKLHLLEDAIPRLGGVVLDESSVLKSFTGKTRRDLTEKFARTPYRLCCTATPSPNDFTELGQHAEFLGVCKTSEMLATWFLNDTFDTGTWRLKRHAEKDFWRWVSSWAACVSKPSDIGGSDEGSDLPPLNIESVTVSVNQKSERGSETLFVDAHTSATSIHSEMRRTCAERAAKAAEIANGTTEPVIIWCNTNDEADALIELLPEAVEVRGSDKTSHKEKAVEWFLGYNCTCDFTTKRFSSKLSPCGKRNTQPNVALNTDPIQSRDPSESSKDDHPLKTQNTCVSITQTIQTSSSEPQRKNAHETRAGEQLMPPMNQSEYQLEVRQRNGRNKTPKSDLLKGSNHLESVPPNTGTYSQNKVGDAQSAGQQNQETTLSDQRVESADCTLTTATLPEELEESCALTATSGSENSEMTQNFSIERQCSCGYKSGKRVLISKPSICGFGLNFQHCRTVVFVGLSYSFEDFYQAVRRSYRFGQTKPVNVYLIQADSENNVLPVLKRKMAQHETMREALKFTAANLSESHSTITMNAGIKTETGKNWTMHNGDCVRITSQIPDNSIGFSVFSPPFADLFTYSNDIQDMGNCSDLSEFMEQFDFLIENLGRITMPGRHCAVHCCDLLSTKWKHGKIEFQDFSGTIARAFRKRGWLLHSRITIWKDPVTEMQRTKAHGLLYKTLRGDSADSRVGAPDYLLVFRKPGENPVPIEHTPSSLPLDKWQELASPVWWTVNQMRVLDYEVARGKDDEKHICPLQLDVIERALTLWSAPNDLVLSPFGGIGSEGYCAVKMGRQFVGCELKPEYFNRACHNLRMANQDCEMDLFKSAA